VSRIKSNPNFSKGYLRKGDAEFDLKKYDLAKESYAKGLNIDKSNL
jgi:tetratricopeptide (TPR) repeat protein